MTYVCAVRHQCDLSSKYLPATVILLLAKHHTCVRQVRTVQCTSTFQQCRKWLDVRSDTHRFLGCHCTVQRKLSVMWEYDLAYYHIHVQQKCFLVHSVSTGWRIIFPVSTVRRQTNYNVSWHKYYKQCSTCNNLTRKTKGKECIHQPASYQWCYAQSSYAIIEPSLCRIPFLTFVHWCCAHILYVSLMFQWCSQNCDVAIN